MKRKTAKLLLGVGILAVGLAIGLSIARSSEERLAGSTGSSLSLSVPAFAQAVPADQFPMNEAGISAYVDLGEEIDLARARSVFKGIEADQEGYIVGFIELPGSAEDMWPHAYVGKDGWLIAYYPKTEPTSRLFQWVGYQRDEITTTTLKDALAQMCQQMALDSSKAEQGLSYCHCQYPDATKLLFAVDTTGGGSDTFKYTIPRGLTLYEASWSHHAHGVSYNGSGTTVNGEGLCSAGGGTYVVSGTLETRFTIPGPSHNVEVRSHSGWSGCALLFLYR